MAYGGVNISIPVKFEIKLAPRGMTDYDPKSLSPHQQKETNIYKMAIRRENINYLYEHPEVRGIIAFVVRNTVTHHPRDTVKFVAELFSRPEHQIREEIGQILCEPSIESKTIPYTEFEEFEY